MLNVAVLVSGGGTNLAAIINAIRNETIKNAQVSIVVSNKKDAYALTRAQQAGLKAATLLREDYSSQQRFEQGLLDVLAKEKADLIVLAGFMSVLSSHFISHYENRIINIHPSLIPAFCGKGFYGLTPHKAALEMGVKITGATVHYVNEQVDAGRILLQKAVEVYENDTPETLQKRVMEQAEWEILPKAINMLANEKRDNG